METIEEVVTLSEKINSNTAAKKETDKVTIFMIYSNQNY